MERWMEMRQLKREDGKPITLMNVWSGFYRWCEENNIPITETQRRWISEFPPLQIAKDTPADNLGYYLTEHFENLKWPAMPEDIKNIILKDKVERMTLWNWPTWGFKDVMHLKPTATETE
jgi:hypothetical protein